MLTFLHIFELVSGMKINLSKCGLVAINVEHAELTSFTTFAGRQIMHWPLTYLGAPLGGNPHLEAVWEPVVDRVARCLDG